MLQGYANSAVCTATRTALITGRYQYRLRLGLEEPLGAGNTRGRPAAGASDAAVAAEESRLFDDAHRQVASRRTAEIRSAQERLRPLLRISQRRHRLLPARRHRSQARFLGRRHTHRANGLRHRTVRQSRRRRRQRVREGAPALLSSVCISMRRTGRGKRPAIRQNPNA